MSRPHTSLPPELVGGFFTVGAGLSAGLSEGRLRGRDLAHPTRGVRGPQGVESFAARVRAMACVLPGTWALSHASAARWLDLPLPWTWRPDERLTVMRATSTPPLTRATIDSRRGLERRDIVVVDGVPVTDVVSTWCDLGSILGLDALVAAGDAVMWRRRDDRWTEFAEWEPTRVLLDRQMERLGRSPGAARRREALELLRPNVRSPRETAVRLIILRAGLPEPHLNATVTDDGQWLGIVDFLWEEERVIAEYEGDHHRTDRGQWHADVGRYEQFADLGYRVVRITAADLATERARHTLVCRLRTALQRNE